MDLLIVLTYVALSWVIFKIFKLPVNQWSLSTTALGGIVLVSSLVLLMNYNHPYTSQAQRGVITIPLIPQVTGVVSDVSKKTNQFLQKGEILFRLEDTRYKNRVERLEADLVTAKHSVISLKAQYQEMKANTVQLTAVRDMLKTNYNRYIKGSYAKVNPFSVSEIDNARQRYLAQEAKVKGSMSKQEQIKSQLESILNGEESQIASVRAQLAEAKYDLEQTVIRAPSNGYITQVLIRPGSYAAAFPLRPVMIFVPEQKKIIVTQFRQNSFLRLNVGNEAEVIFNTLPGKVFRGKLKEILPVVPGGAYQAQGVVQAIATTPGMDSLIGIIELDKNSSIKSLPDGVSAQVAIYSENFKHISVMRKVLLRMNSWLHYLYLDH